MAPVTWTRRGHRPPPRSAHRAGQGAARGGPSHPRARGAWPQPPSTPGPVRPVSTPMSRSASPLRSTSTTGPIRPTTRPVEGRADRPARAPDTVPRPWTGSKRRVVARLRSSGVPTDRCSAPAATGSTPTMTATMAMPLTTWRQLKTSPATSISKDRDPEPDPGRYGHRSRCQHHRFRGGETCRPPVGAGVGQYP